MNEIEDNDTTITLKGSITLKKTWVKLFQGNNE